MDFIYGEILDSDIANIYFLFQAIFLDRTIIPWNHF